MPTLLHVFDKAASHTTQKFYTKDRHKFFRPESFASIYDKARKLATYLARAGVEPGDTIAIFSDNRTKWLIADMGVQMSGGVTVPRGSDSTAKELEFILGHCGAKVIFLEHQRLFKKMAGYLKKNSQLKIIILDDNFPATLREERFVVLLSEIIYDTDLKIDSVLLEKIKESISPQSLFTIIYTSGTTGNPKGAMLSHANMLYQLSVIPKMLEMSYKDRVLSILPVWHIFERFMLYCVIDSGACYYYSTPKDLMEDFIRVKPTLMASAPRVWEQIYIKLHERIEKTEAFNREMFELAYSLKKNIHRARNELTGNTAIVEKPGFLETIKNTLGSIIKIASYTLPEKYLDPIFLMRVRAMIGGELRATISGGGALPLHIDEFFNAIGIPVYEGYGMTECSPLIAMRMKGKIIEGTVGFTPPGTEIRLIKENGEKTRQGETGVIHVRGPGVMKGYFLNEEASKVILDDGWLNTGDIGLLSANGALSIKGRAKDTIVLIGGENVEPVPIETALTQHPLIDQAVVIGQDRKNPGVLIWPDFDKLEEAGFNVSEFDRTLDLNKFPDILKLFRSVVSTIISEENGFSNFERIAHIAFLPDKLRTGETLTALLKIKRNVIAEKYKELIGRMYEAHK